MTTEVQAGGDYRIDYDDVDVVDLMSQIRARSAHASSVSANLPEALSERARARVRAAVDLDDRKPYELQRDLQLEGSWNVSPEDLISSKRRGAGLLVAGTRRLVRPLVKMFANLDLPLYKQFKINLGVAEALHELICRVTELEARIETMSRRIETLESSRNGVDGGND
jgi:hypothetical protein